MRASVPSVRHVLCWWCDRVTTPCVVVCAQATFAGLGLATAYEVCVLVCTCAGGCGLCACMCVCVVVTLESRGASGVDVADACVFTQFAIVHVLLGAAGVCSRDQCRGQQSRVKLVGRGAHVRRPPTAG